MGQDFTTTVRENPDNYRSRMGRQFTQVTMFNNYNKRGFTSPYGNQTNGRYHGFTSQPTHTKTAMNQHLSLPSQAIGRFLNSININPHTIYLLIELSGGLFLSKIVRGTPMDPWDFLKGAGWLSLYSIEGSTNLLTGVFLILQISGLVLSSSGLMDTYQVQS